jgi:hypothetical protein
MIPGEIFPVEGFIEINAGAEVVTMLVANTGDRPVQVGSHYHFAEANEGLAFDREAARTGCGSTSRQGRRCGSSRGRRGRCGWCPMAGTGGSGGSIMNVHGGAGPEWGVTARGGQDATPDRARRRGSGAWP